MKAKTESVMIPSFLSEVKRPANVAIRQKFEAFRSREE